MKPASALILGLTASASAGIAKRQSGPVESDTIKGCTYYDQSNSISDDCQHFEDYWGLDHAVFVAWVSLNLLGRLHSANEPVESIREE
jgi:hypothetical protein